MSKLAKTLSSLSLSSYRYQVCVHILGRGLVPQVVDHPNPTHSPVHHVDVGSLPLPSNNARLRPIILLFHRFNLWSLSSKLPLDGRSCCSLALDCRINTYSTTSTTSTTFFSSASSSFAQLHHSAAPHGQLAPKEQRNMLLLRRLGPKAGQLENKLFLLFDATPDWCNHTLTCFVLLPFY